MKFVLCVKQEVKTLTSYSHVEIAWRTFEKSKGYFALKFKIKASDVLANHFLNNKAHCTSIKNVLLFTFMIISACENSTFLQNLKPEIKKMVIYDLQKIGIYLI